jgi:hypothetical protein
LERIAEWVMVCAKFIQGIFHRYVGSGDYSHEKLEWKAMIYTLVTLINHSGMLHVVEKCYNLRSLGSRTYEKLG